MNRQGEFPVCFRLHGKPYSPIPWISALHLDDCFFQLCLLPCQEMTPDRIFLLGPAIRSKRCYQPNDVGRTAGTGIPFRTAPHHMTIFRLYFRNTLHHLQRIHIEERLPVQLHAAQDRIEQLLLHDIRVFSQWFDIQHPFGEHHHRNRSAGLGIHGIIWKIIVKSKGFPVMSGADSARDVHLLTDDIIP